jgi:transposase-like protein
MRIVRAIKGFLKPSASSRPIELIKAASEIASDKLKEGDILSRRREGSTFYSIKRPEFLKNGGPVYLWSEILDALVENGNDFESAMRFLEQGIEKRAAEEKAYSSWNSRKNMVCPRCGSEDFKIDTTVRIGGPERKGDPYLHICSYCGLNVNILEFKSVRKSRLMDFIRKEQIRYFNPVSSRFVFPHKCGTLEWQERMKHNAESLVRYLRENFSGKNDWFSYQDILGFFKDEFDKMQVRKAFGKDPFSNDLRNHGDLGAGIRKYLEIDEKSRKFRFLKKPFKYSVRG